MQKVCEYCENGIFSKNTTFCNRECQANYMKEKLCLGCKKREFHWRQDSEEEGYCSQKCFEDFCKRKLRWDMQNMLGFGYMSHPDYKKLDLIEMQYKIKNNATGEIYEQMIDFSEEI